MTILIKQSVSGSIPSFLRMFIAKESSAPSQFDGVEYERSSIKVNPVMIVDEEVPKTHDTAKHWLDCRKLKIVEKVPNVPITGITVHSLEHRGNGGRAYKVIFTHPCEPELQLLADLREVELIDAMFETGIAIGGILPGAYVFARVSSQMKLIRVGSPVHTSLLVTVSRKKDGPLKKSELVVNHIYSTLGGDVRIYLGDFDVSLCDIETVDSSTSGAYQLWSERYTSKRVNFRTEKRPVFIDAPIKYSEDRKRVFDVNHKWNESSYYTTFVGKTITVVKDEGAWNGAVPSTAVLSAVSSRYTPNDGDRQYSSYDCRGKVVEIK